MNYYLLTILIIVLAIIGASILKNVDLETFVTYEKKPYNDWTTGSTPLNYYTLPLYKKPYRFPFQYRTSYPISNMRYYPTHLGN